MKQKILAAKTKDTKDPRTQGASFLVQYSLYRAI